ncbi:MAG: DUF2911 domain-containing protein [Ignavibacteriae bacterium]|nr:DUF2911 domain-containing protein [Ignavibacteriota bacterium]
MKLFYKSIALLLIFFSLIILAQNNPPRLSPRSYVGQTIGYTNVEVKYGSPGVKNRKIWGELVPYNKVWRTGADEATTIEFEKDVIIKNKKIPAGIYSLFTIPTEKEWTIILNKVYDQWGAFKYNQKEDLYRFKVTPKQNSFMERLQFNFDYKAPYITEVNIEWEKIKVSFEINTEIKK